MFVLNKNELRARHLKRNIPCCGVGGFYFETTSCLHAELHRFSLSAVRSSDPDVVAHFQHEREINGDLGLQVT